VDGYILHHQDYSHLNMDGMVDIVCMDVSVSSSVDGCIRHYEDRRDHLKEVDLI